MCLQMQNQLFRKAVNHSEASITQAAIKSRDAKTIASLNSLRRSLCQRVEGGVCQTEADHTQS